MIDRKMQACEEAKNSEEEKEILVLFSQMLLNVYNKMAYIKELSDSKKKIEINKLNWKIPQNLKSLFE